jgi:hypothetical protein
MKAGPKSVPLLWRETSEKLEVVEPQTTAVRSKCFISSQGLRTLTIIHQGRQLKTSKQKRNTCTGRLYDGDHDRARW